MWWPIRGKYPECRPEDIDTCEYDYVVVGGMFIIIIDAFSIIA